MSPVNILCFSTTPWNAPQFGSRQQVMKRLAAKHEILYVEPLISPHRFLLGEWRHAWEKPPVRKVLHNVWVFNPGMGLIPRYQWPMNALNQRWLYAKVKRVLTQLTMTPDLLWTYWPNSSFHF